MQMTTEMAGNRKHWHDMIQAGTLPSIEAGRPICEKVRTILNNYCSGLFFNVKCLNVIQVKVSFDPQIIQSMTQINISVVLN